MPVLDRSIVSLIASFFSLPLSSEYGQTGSVGNNRVQYHPRIVVRKGTYS